RDAHHGGHDPPPQHQRAAPADRRLRPLMRALLLLVCLGGLRVRADAPPPAPDPSVERLGSAYRRSRDPDKRFWIVDALERVLETKRDETALEPLLLASADPKPDVRRRALGALEGWRELPEPARRRWQGRLAQAVGRAERDPSARVREAGRVLDAALKRPPSSSAGLPEPAREGRGRAAAAAAI